MTGGNPPDPCLEQQNARDAKQTSIEQKTDQIGDLADQIVIEVDELEELDAILTACRLEHPEYVPPPMALPPSIEPMPDVQMSHLCTKTRELADLAKYVRQLIKAPKI